MDNILKSTEEDKTYMYIISFCIKPNKSNHLSYPDFYNMEFGFDKIETGETDLKEIVDKIFDYIKRGNRDLWFKTTKEDIVVLSIFPNGFIV